MVDHMRVLITDGNERASLAVVRALGYEGVEVVVGTDTPHSLAGRSRYCTREFVYPSPYRNPEGFLSTVAKEVRHSSPDAIYPMAEMSMELIGRHQQEFGGPSVVPAPALELFTTMSDKFALMQLAQRLSIPIPDTVFVTEGNLEEVETGIKDYPVVVKPARSLVQKGEKWYKTTVHVAKDRQALGQLYKEHHYLQGLSLIQHRVVGEGQGVFALMQHGRPAALFAHRRIRERPPSGGISVLRESIAPPQPMTDYALRLLQHVGWHGVAMVEFKIDQASGIPYLMEINGRFWGSLQLAVDAGVNFPYLLLLMAKGRLPSGPFPAYRAGVRSRWLLGDLDHLLLRLFKAEEKQRLPPGAPTGWKTIVNFLRPGGKNTFYEIERLNDWRPAWTEYSRYVTALVRKGSA
jgi:predicted ATP-grasp superfamily ATP-dependent carboligase